VGQRRPIFHVVKEGTGVYTPLVQGYATFANAQTTIGPISVELGDLGPDNQLRTIAEVREVID
jgi:hypothetical protein